MSEYKKIGVNDRIKYTDIDKTFRERGLGKAEFEICPVFEEGEMTDIYIHRKQQRNEERKYHLEVECERITCFSITGERCEFGPRIYRNFFCKQHNTISFVVYVPIGTDNISFEYHFGNKICIVFGKEVGEGI